MSKQDKAKEINTNSIISGFIAPQPTASDKADNTKKVISKKEVFNDIAPSKSTNNKLKNNINKSNNYTITFKIDADIDDYLKNIDKITFIESIKSGKIESTTKTEFVNNLIREQFYKLIGVSVKDDADTINQKWLKYKEDNNL